MARYPFVPIKPSPVLSRCWPRAVTEPSVFPPRAGISAVVTAFLIVESCVQYRIYYSYVCVGSCVLCRDLDVSVAYR